MVTSSALADLTADDVSIAVIFAIKSEWEKACQLFVDKPTDLHPVTEGRLTYNRCRIGKNVVALILLHKIGTNVAAVYAGQACTTFKNLKLIVMCGIAGAIPNPAKPEFDIRLGDIVYSGPTGVVQHDHIKDKVDDTKNPKEYAKIYRGQRSGVSAKLITIAQTLQNPHPGDDQWPWVARMESMSAAVKNEFPRPLANTDKLLSVPPPAPGDQAEDTRKTRKGKHKAHPHVFGGGIASGNHLLKNPRYRDELAKAQDLHQFKCIEMESAGIAEAAEYHEKPFFVIRGISDYCDMEKADGWHKYAAAVAAAFTWCVLSKLSDLLKDVENPPGAGPQKAMTAAATSQTPTDSKQTSVPTTQLITSVAAAPAPPPIARHVHVPTTEPHRELPQSVDQHIVGALDDLALVYRTIELDKYYKQAQELEAFLDEHGARASGDLRARGYIEVANAYLRLAGSADFDKDKMKSEFDRTRAKVQAVIHAKT